MPNMRHRDRNFKSMRRQAKIREVGYDDLYRYNVYQTSYASTVRGRKPNRRLNGRSMGVCNSCQRRRR